MEEKQKLFKLFRNLNFNGESISEPYTPTAQSLGGTSAADGFYSPELRGEFGAGLLDLHAMDDTELLSDVCYSVILCIIKAMLFTVTTDYKILKCLLPKHYTTNFTLFFMYVLDESLSN